MNPTTQSKEYADLSGSTPSELLMWASEGSDSEKETAVRLLVESYLGWLKAILEKPLRSHGLVGEAEDFAIRAIQKAIAKASAFKEVADESPEEQDKRFRKYLLIIAKRLVQDRLRGYPKFYEVDELFWETLAAPEQVHAEKTPLDQARLNAVNQALAQLPEREREILLAFLEFGDISNPQSKLPRNVIADLCHRFDTTPANIRAIKSRAKKKLKSYLDDEGITQ